MATREEHQTVLLELLEEFDRVCKKYDITYMLFAGSALGAVRHGGFIPWDDDLDIAMSRSEYERFLDLAPGEVSDKYYVQGEFSNHWPLHFSKLRKNGTTCLEKYHPKDPQTHQGIYIDIFPYDNAADNPLLNRLQFFCSRVVLAKTMLQRGYETDSLLKKVFMTCCRVLPLKLCHTIAVGEQYAESKMVHTFFGGTSKYKKGLYLREWFSQTREMPFEHLTVPVSARYDELLTTMYGDYMVIPSEEERKRKVHAVLVDTERSYTEYAGYLDGMRFDTYTRSIR